MARTQSQAGQGSDRPAEIRRLVPADWAALRQARLAALAEAPYAFSSTLERELGFDEELWRGRIASSAIFMAWQDGQPAGMAAGVSEQGARAAGYQDAGAGASHMLSMWVSPQARGRGVGDGLVEAVCDWARADGAARVELWVTDVNARARRFYQRAGFVGTGRRQQVRPDEPDHWEQQMERQLG
jgi:ribosomal protein S18 acetylase RimI-like enzyme